MISDGSFDVWLRGGLFLSLLLLFVLAESLAPRRRRRFRALDRWATNFGIAVVNTFALRILGPVTAAGAALYAGQLNLGLLNHTNLPDLAELIIAVILFDLAIYGQHVATHKIPLLWRLHKVHHCDPDFDVSTALRFHPAEILLSMIYKAGIAMLIGPAVFAVIIYEIVLNGSAMFNHANLRLPGVLDKVLRLFIVTPDMHRVHHSVHQDETDSNYGNFLPWWDRLFRTYKTDSRDGQTGMTIGLSDYPGEDPVKFFWTLKLPFRAGSSYIGDGERDIL